MRYMGDAVPGLNETLKQQMIAAAPNMTDGQAQDLSEIVEATHYGKNLKWTRYGVGAIVGALVGAVLISKFKKKR